MTINFIASEQNHTTALSLDIDRPLGVQEGDLLFATIQVNDQQISPPSGWVEMDTTLAGTLLRNYVFYKVATNSEPTSYNFQKDSGSVTWGGIIFAFSGTHLTDPIAVHEVDTDTTNAPEPRIGPDLNSVVAGEKVLSFRQTRSTEDGPAGWSVESGHTILGEFQPITTGTNYAHVLAISDSSKSTSGKFLGVGITATHTETHNIQRTVSLRPSGGSVPPTSKMSLAAEGTLLTDAATNSSLIELSTIGSSVNASPIRAVRIGNPPPALTDQVDLYVQGGVHGNEPAGREGLLWFIRELGKGNPAAEDLVAGKKIIIVPNVNPDGIDAGNRNNANNEDLNRDWWHLDQPETQAVAELLETCLPLVAVDLHESQNNIDENNDVEFRAPRNPNAFLEINGLAVELRTRAIDYALSNGWSADIYIPPATSNFVGGTTNFDSHALLRHSVGFLVESNFGTGYVFENRALIQRQFVDDLFRWIEDRSNDLPVVRASAESYAITVGSAASEPFNVRTATIDPPPTGYDLTGDVPTYHLGVFNIDVANDVVQMAQVAHPAIPFLVDGSSSADVRVASGTRLFEHSPNPPFIPGLDIPDTSGSYASTDDSSLDITGNLSLRAYVYNAPWDGSEAANRYILAKWNTSDARAYALRVASGSGDFQFAYSENGINFSTVTCTAAVRTDTFGGVAVRADLDISGSVTFYMAASMDGAWTQLGDVVSIPPVTALFVSNQEPLLVGRFNSGGSGAFAIHVSSIQVWDDQTLVADTRFDQQLAGATSFVDDTSLTWTISGDAEILSDLRVASSDVVLDLGISGQAVAHTDTSASSSIGVLAGIDPTAQKSVVADSSLGILVDIFTFFNRGIKIDVTGVTKSPKSVKASNVPIETEASLNPVEVLASVDDFFANASVDGSWIQGAGT